MQTVITWTKYDGTPETLPMNSEEWEALDDAFDNRIFEEMYIVCRNGKVFWQGAAHIAFYDEWIGPEWRFAECEHRVHIGDLWAPWPEAPEDNA